MPVGVQLIGHPWQEELLLEVAIRLERIARSLRERSPAELLGRSDDPLQVRDGNRGSLHAEYGEHGMLRTQLGIGATGLHHFGGALLGPFGEAMPA